MRKIGTVYPCIPQFFCIKVGFKGVYIARTCFPDFKLNLSLQGMMTILGAFYNVTKHFIFN